jgi:glycosyltransferase involved in cell wall biosynthesis
MRAKWVIKIGLQRVWKLLPATWVHLLHQGVYAAARWFPTPLQNKVRGFFAHLLAGTTSMEQQYPIWLRCYERTGRKAHRAAAAHIAGFGKTPLISILLPVFDPNPDHLRAAIGSVQDQFYPEWELCVADRSSVDPSVATLLSEAKARDSRIRLVRTDPHSNLLPAAAEAFGLASGQYIALLDHASLLSPRALYEVAAELVSLPGTDVVYSDEDQIDDAGRRSMPYFKPDWNPELMLGQNLIGQLATYRKSLVERVGGLQGDIKEGAGYDLGLRAVAATSPDHIVHIPKILYHSRQTSDNHAVSESVMAVRSRNNQRAVAEFLKRGSSGIPVDATPSTPFWGRVTYPVPQPEPLVSVIIPTRNHADMLARTIAGLLDRTDYPSLMVLIVDNGSDDPAALALLEQLSLDNRVSVLRRPGPFNYSALNNDAVREASGELILLLNNDIDVIHTDWLREMVSHAIRPGIGAVGAKLLYPDQTIQHGGVTVGMYGVAEHQFLEQSYNDPGYFDHLKLARNVTAVTGACLMVRRQTYLEVGGLNEVSLPVAFNDVDFCLKLTERGYRNLWTPHARLYHLESASRGYDHTSEKSARLKLEIAYMRQRWAYKLDHDPQWNPNLSLHSTSVRLAFPPRTP